MVTRYVGIGLEDSGYGEESTLSPLMVDIVESNLQGGNNDVELSSKIGSRQRTQKTTQNYTVTGELVMPVIDHFPLILHGLLGEITTTEINSSGYYRHKIFEGFDAPSFTIYEGKDYFEKMFLGCVANELTIEARSNFLEATIGVHGSHDVERDLRTVDGSDFPDQVYSTLSGELYRGGAEITPDVKSLQFSVSSSFGVEEKIPFHKRWPDKIPRPSELTYSMSSTIKFDGIEELRRFWGATDAQKPQEKKLDEPISIEFKPVPDQREFVINLPRNVMVGQAAPIDGRNEVEQTVTYEGMLNPTNYSGITFEVVNGHDGSIYSNP